MDKTVIFESKYKTPISNFSTTTEVDKFLEEKLGRKLEVVNVPGIQVKKIDWEFKSDVIDLNKIRPTNK